MTSQKYESFIPVYDAVPEKWEDARPFIVEILKKISEGINVREIGFHLEEQLLSGKQFIPISIQNGQYREIFRKVINTGALIAGANPPVAHGINFDSRFTLIDLWVSATNSSLLNAVTMSNPQNVTINSTNINIISPAAYDRSFAVCEYLLEV